ncbi:MAG: PepSY-like domain-containing protein [Prevotella sp.]|nr:PepSY-like domain-containing protein [Prevotella sp.]
MKKTISMVSNFIHRMTRPAAEKKREKLIFAESLPTETKYFLQRNFPGRSIAFAEMKTTSKSTTYVATLNDGIQISFNENGAWEKIDCKMGVVPAALVPSSVAAFMNAFYPGIPLVKIEKSDVGYEVTLSNFASLKFNHTENVA